MKIKSALNKNIHLNVYFLRDRDAGLDLLFPWFFLLLRHPSGNLRYAAVRMIENDLGPLTVHIRCPEYKSERLKPEQADRILLALLISLNGLSDELYDPKYKRYKYIDALPTCPYKSV